MSEQVYANHNAQHVEVDEAKEMREQAAVDQKAKVAREAGKVIDKELEAVLDDIDTVLEDEEFAQTYRQAGGE